MSLSCQSPRTFGDSWLGTRLCPKILRSLTECRLFLEFTVAAFRDLVEEVTQPGGCSAAGLWGQVSPPPAPPPHDAGCPWRSLFS